MQERAPASLAWKIGPSDACPHVRPRLRAAQAVENHFNIVMDLKAGGESAPARGSPPDPIYFLTPSRRSSRSPLPPLPPAWERTPSSGRVRTRARCASALRQFENARSRGSRVRKIRTRSGAPRPKSSSTTIANPSGRVDVRRTTERRFSARPAEAPRLTLPPRSQALPQSLSRCALLICTGMRH